MATPAPDLDLDLSDLSPAAWLARMGEVGDDHGFWERIGAAHHALLVESPGAAGRRLLVTFETVEEARRAPGARPRGFEQVTRQGWSLLAILARGDTFFRDPALWRNLDRWTDDGLFEDFERVLFAGAGAGGYAAAAYSVAAPGARVLALRPVATLDPSVAGWDRRHPEARRLDWTSRYGFAPAMLEAAARATIVHDPLVDLDAMHASLFRGPNVVALRAPGTGPAPEAALEAMAMLPVMLDLAMEDGLDATAFRRLWRLRQSSAGYLRRLLRRCEERGRPDLALRVARAGLDTVDRPLFARKLAALRAPRAAQAAAG